jgi:hypothetical protein
MTTGHQHRVLGHTGQGGNLNEAIAAAIGIYRKDGVQAARRNLHEIGDGIDQGISKS